MNDAFLQRVRAAAAAGWWTVAIGAVGLTVGWLVFLLVMAARPAWLMSLWGGDGIVWTDYQKMALWYFAGLKAVLLVGVLASLWLTLWHRRLRRDQ